MAELVEDRRHAIPRVVAIVSALLERFSERNDSDTDTDSDAARKSALVASSSAFRGVSKPGISVRSYLERIFRYANCSPSCYVVAYIYLDRFASRHPSVLIDSFSVHRFIITSVLTAVKFLDDIYYNNTYYAKVGGISLKEMNYLEVDFLFGVGFELNVTPVDFASYCSVLQSQMHHLEFPPAPAPPPPRSTTIFSSSEEDQDSRNCQQQQQQLAAVREVLLGTYS